MKTPQNLIKAIIAGAIFFGQFDHMNAQMVGPDAYLKGTYVEVGVTGIGGFEGVPVATSPPLAGMHPRSSTGYFGFVANPQMNAWTTFDGDFFTPGSPENGWGFEIGLTGTPGSTKNGNNCSFTQEINGSITSWTYAAPVYNCVWEGDALSGTSLHFKIEYQLSETDLFYLTTISITNNTSSIIPDMYYYRNVDPDNNEEIGFDFTTTNTIVNQPTGCCNIAQVSATSTVPATQPMSYYSLLSQDSTDNWRAGYGGFSNRDASDMFNGIGFTQTIGSVNFADEAIYMAYHIINLAPGATETFKMCSLFASTELNCALSALAVNQTPFAQTCITAPPFALTGGTPAGGTYSGTGVTGGNMFNPSLAGNGTYAIYYSVTDSTGCTATAVSPMVVGVCAGINEIQSSSVSVYPNPFNESTTFSVDKSVQLKDAEFKLFDVVGKEVRSISGINSRQFTLEKNELSAGVYFYKLSNNGREIANGKVVIK